MRSSFSRFLFPAAIILLVALLLVGAVFLILAENYLDQQAMEGLKTDCQTISSLASAYYAQNTLSREEFLINLSVASRVSDADAVICDLSGQLVLCSDAPLGCEHQGKMIQNQSFLKQVISTGYATFTGSAPGLYEDTRYLVCMPIRDILDQPIGFVLLSTPMARTRTVIKQMFDLYLPVSILVVLVAGTFITISARKQANPLKELAQTASAFGHGKLHARVKINPSTPEEVQELALAFNNMASSLQKSEYQRQEFVANVSHELKTPMTTISGMVDGMLDGTIPPEKHTHYMQIVSDETKRLSRLVRSMLDISRLQDQPIPEDQKMHFDLEEAAGQVLITFEQKIVAKNLDVDVDFPEHPVFTFAGKDYVTQVVYNLIDNAVKFCPEGGTLGLKIREAGKKAYISISNDGDTIPAEELPLVFDRFHKLDKARTRTKDSWGLGLYIVKTIVCSHGENISVTSKNGKTEFTFTMPLVN